MKKFSIKKKLIISNILMIVIPIVCFLIFLAIGLCIFDFTRWDAIENVYESNTGSYSAQSAIFYFKDKIEESHNSSKKNINYLKKSLDKLNYNFIIYKNNTVLYNNLNKSELDYLNDVISKEIDNLFIENDKESIIGIKFNDSNNTYKIIAYSDAIKITSNKSYSKIKISLITMVIIIILLVLGTIILTNSILSSWITKSILKPLKQLSRGSKEIEKGNLNYKIEYYEKDEFGDVCDEFNKMQKRLKSSDEARVKYEEKRSKIISGVSHDLRTPLTAIKGYVEGLEDGIANTEEKKKKYYTVIKNRVEDIEKLINSLSSLNDIESKNHITNMKKTNLGKYIDKVLNDYKEEFISKKIDIEFKNNRNIYVMLNKDEFKRVFDNLFENTYKYRKMNISKVIIDIKENDNVIINYKDNGPGVKEDELENIFLSFYRGDKARTNPGNGSGLGLSIVKSIVENHHGTISAKNNNGLEFTILLPKIEEDI